MLVACALFSLVNALVVIGAEQLHTLQIVFLRNLFGLLALAPVLPRIWRPLLDSGQRRFYMLRAVVSTLAMVTWFWSLTQLPLALAVSLSFTLPLFITIGAGLFLGETVGPRRWVATWVGLAGVLVIMRPGLDASLLASFAVIVSSILMAASVLMVKSISKTDPPGVIVAYLMILMVPFTGVATLGVWQWPTASLWWIMLLLGVCASLGQWLLVQAMRGRDMSFLAPLDFARLPFSALLGYLLFSQRPDGWTIAGALIIFTSSPYITHRETRVGRRRDTVAP